MQVFIVIQTAVKFHQNMIVGCVLHYYNIAATKKIDTDSVKMQISKHFLRKRTQFTFLTYLIILGKYSFIIYSHKIDTHLLFTATFCAVCILTE